MKKIITILASLVLASSALADANDPLVWQRDPSDCCDVKYDLPQPPASAHGVLIFNGITKLIEEVSRFRGAEEDHLCVGFHRIVTGHKSFLSHAVGKQSESDE